MGPERFKNCRRNSVKTAGRNDMNEELTRFQARQAVPSIVVTDRRKSQTRHGSATPGVGHTGDWRRIADSWGKRFAERRRSSGRGP